MKIGGVNMRKKTNVILVTITILSLFFLDEVKAVTPDNIVDNKANEEVVVSSEVLIEAPNVNVNATSISTLNVEFNDIEGID